MTGSSTLLTGAAGILAASVAATYWIDRVFHPSGKLGWALRIGLPALGAIAAGLVAWYARKAARATSSGANAPPPADDIALRFKEAERRLRTADFEVPRRSLAALPTAVVLGPPGTGKTTAIARSAMVTELLAGDAMRGDAVVATPDLNVWYTDGTIVVDASAATAGDDLAWRRLVKRLRRRWLAASVRHGGTAPRVAVVTLGCDMLIAPRGDEAALGVARALRTRLHALSRAFGLRLPVYVLLTRLDAVPGFASYLQTFSDDEIGDVLGATLPAVAPVPAATWADVEFRRLDAEARALVAGLAEHRLELLARDRTPDFAADAFDFPNGVQRVLDAAIPAMLELCRPSQLEISPFLRGFYLTGTREVALDATPPAPSTASSFADPLVPAPRSIMDGIRDDDDDDHGVPVIRWDDDAPAPAVVNVGAQHVFLDGIWQQVILRDENARAVSASGQQAARFQRAIAAAGLFVAGVTTIGLSTSYAANAGMQERLANTARAAITALPGEAGLPGVEVLQRVDSLRTEVAQLRTWQDSGVPLRYRWGLYSGGALLRESRGAYFGALDRLALGETRQRIVETLRRLPAEPGNDYGTAYRLLKAYLVTSSRPDKSSASFLTPVLEEYWMPSDALDPERRGLIRQQFDFYATELPRGNPYPASDDPGAVQAARGWLERFTGAAPIYEAMIADVSARSEPAQLAREVPTARGVVNAPYTVPGAFTRRGADLMADALLNVSRYYDVEEWVLGKRTLIRSQKDSLVAELRALYLAQAREHWRSYLRSTSVAPFGNAADAAVKLRTLSGNSSPLLGALALASRNTGAGPFAPYREFQPSHHVAPPTLRDRYIDSTNAAYAQALLDLQAAMEQVAVAPTGQGEMQAQQARASVTQLRTAAGALAQGFQVDREGNIDGTVRRLLEQPAVHAERLLGRVGAGETNASGPQLCSRFAKLAGRAPFGDDWSSPADVADVKAFFHPQNGFLAGFRSEVLEPLLVRQGNTWAPKPGAPTRVSSTFLGFFNRATGVGDALFAGGSDEPVVRFSFRPVLSNDVPQVSLTIDGRTHTWTRSSTASQTFTWNGSSAQAAALTVMRADGTSRDVLRFAGTWSLFRLFDAASRWTPAGASWRAEWRSPEFGESGELAFELNTATGTPVFRRGWFDGLRCTNRLVD